MNVGAAQAYGGLIRDLIRPRDADTHSARPASVSRERIESGGSSSRDAKLALIKQRIKAGFYNSSEVTEDLSESFAKVFDKLA